MSGGSKDDKDCCDAFGASFAAKIAYIVFSALILAGIVPIIVGWLATVRYELDPDLPARENEQRAREAMFLRENYDACILGGLTIVVIGMMSILMTLLIEFVLWCSDDGPDNYEDLDKKSKPNSADTKPAAYGTVEDEKIE